jgi:hypothetical protein
MNLGDRDGILDSHPSTNHTPSVDWESLYTVRNPPVNSAGGLIRSNNFSCLSLRASRSGELMWKLPHPTTETPTWLKSLKKQAQDLPNEQKDGYDDKGKEVANEITDGVVPSKCMESIRKETETFTSAANKTADQAKVTTPSLSQILERHDPLVKGKKVKLVEELSMKNNVRQGALSSEAETSVRSMIEHVVAQPELIRAENPVAGNITKKDVPSGVTLETAALLVVDENVEEPAVAEKAKRSVKKTRKNPAPFKVGGEPKSRARKSSSDKTKSKPLSSPQATTSKKALSVDEQTENNVSNDLELELINWIRTAKEKKVNMSLDKQSGCFKAVSTTSNKDPDGTSVTSSTTKSVETCNGSLHKKEDDVSSTKPSALPRSKSADAGSPTRRKVRDNIQPKDENKRSDRATSGLNSPRRHRVKPLLVYRPGMEINCVPLGPSSSLDESKLSTSPRRPTKTKFEMVRSPMKKKKATSKATESKKSLDTRKVTFIHGFLDEASRKRNIVFGSKASTSREFSAKLPLDFTDFASDDFSIIDFDVPARSKSAPLTTFPTKQISEWKPFP